MATVHDNIMRYDSVVIFIIAYEYQIDLGKVDIKRGIRTNKGRNPVDYPQLVRANKKKTKKNYCDYS